jgi:serine/threonine protein kinase
VKLNGRYLLGPLIGEGGFGRTYQATDESNGAQVVVKELTLRGLPDWKPVEHFEREAKVLASLEHPGVPSFIESFTIGGQDDDEGGDLRYFIVSERVEGETLQARIEAGYRWTPESAEKLTAALLEILSYLHSMVPPVVHRDIKPANIVLRADGAPVLVDFGAVRDLGASGNTMATVLGTPGYMAPEQSLGRSDARSDLYGLGTTLAHVFTHRHPQELLDESMRLDAKALSSLPDPVRAVVARLTEPDPSARPANAKEALDPPRQALQLAAPASSQALARGEHLPAPAHGRELSAEMKNSAFFATMRPEVIRARLPLIALAGVGAALLIPLLPGAAPLAPLAILGTMATIFGGRLLDARRARRAAEFGIQTSGHITAANAAQQGTFLQFEYEVEGQKYAGHGYSRDALAIAKLEKGSPITVYYDPAKPETCLGSLDPL